MSVEVDSGVVILWKLLIRAARAEGKEVKSIEWKGVEWTVGKEGEVQIK